MKLIGFQTPENFIFTSFRCSGTSSSFPWVMLWKIFKGHQPKARDGLCLPLLFRLSFHLLSSSFWNRYLPLTFTFCGLMNCIDDVSSPIKQRLVEDSILLLETIKVFI